MINRFGEKIINKTIYILKSKFSVFRNNIFVPKCY